MFNFFYLIFSEQTIVTFIKYTYNFFYCFFLSMPPEDAVRVPIQIWSLCKGRPMNNHDMLRIGLQAVPVFYYTILHMENCAAGEATSIISDQLSAEETVFLTQSIHYITECGMVYMGFYGDTLLPPPGNGGNIIQSLTFRQAEEGRE